MNIKLEPFLPTYSTTATTAAAAVSAVASTTCPVSKVHNSCSSSSNSNHLPETLSTNVNTPPLSSTPTSAKSSTSSPPHSSSLSSSSTSSNSSNNSLIVSARSIASSVSSNIANNNSNSGASSIQKHNSHSNSLISQTLLNNTNINYHTQYNNNQLHHYSTSNGNSMIQKQQYSPSSHNHHLYNQQQQQHQQQMHQQHFGRISHYILSSNNINNSSSSSSSSSYGAVRQSLPSSHSSNSLSPTIPQTHRPPSPHSSKSSCQTYLNNHHNHHYHHYYHQHQHQHSQRIEDLENDGDYTEESFYSKNHTQNNVNKHHQMRHCSNHQNLPSLIPIPTHNNHIRDDYPEDEQNDIINRETNVSDSNINEKSSSNPYQTDDIMMGDELDDDFDEPPLNNSQTNNNNSNQMIHPVTNGNQQSSLCQANLAGGASKIRKRSANQAYEYLTSLNDSKSFQEWLSGNETDFTWVHKRNSMTNAGRKFYYICNYRIKKGYIRCPAVIYALFPNSVDSSVVVYSCGDHEHKRVGGGSGINVNLSNSENNKIVVNSPIKSTMINNNPPVLHSYQQQQQQQKTLMSPSSLSKQTNVMNNNIQHRFVKQNPLNLLPNATLAKTNKMPISPNNKISVSPTNTSSQNIAAISATIDNSVSPYALNADGYNGNDVTVNNTGNNNDENDYDDDDEDDDYDGNGDKNTKHVDQEFDEVERAEKKKQANRTNLDELDDEDESHYLEKAQTVKTNLNLEADLNVSADATNKSYAPNYNNDLNENVANNQKESLSENHDQTTSVTVGDESSKIMNHFSPNLLDNKDAYKNPLHHQNNNTKKQRDTEGQVYSNQIIDNEKSSFVNNKHLNKKRPFAFAMYDQNRNQPAQPYSHLSSNYPCNNNNNNNNNVSTFPPSSHKANSNLGSMSRYPNNLTLNTNNNMSVNSNTNVAGSDLIQNYISSKNFNKAKHQHREIFSKYSTTPDNQTSLLVAPVSSAIQSKQMHPINNENAQQNQLDHHYIQQPQLAISPTSSIASNVSTSSTPSSNTSMQINNLVSDALISPSTNSANIGLVSIGVNSNSTNKYGMPRAANLTIENAPVHIDVGGHIYTSSLETLTKHPDSKLSKMFNGQIPIVLDRTKQHYFIDRDGKSFRHILNYMRTDRLILPENFDDYEILFVESKYYGLDMMSKHLEDLIESRKKQHHSLSNTSKRFKRTVHENEDNNDSYSTTEQVAQETKNNSDNETSSKISVNTERDLISNNSDKPTSASLTTQNASCDSNEKLIDDTCFDQISKPKQTAIILKSAFKTATGTSIAASSAVIS